MDPQHSPAHAAVFVDHTGRRRRVLTVAAVLGTVLVLAMAAILVGGAFSHTSLDVVGWPGGGPTERAEPAATPSTRSATPTRTRTPTPTPTPAQTRRTPTPTPTRATATPTRRPVRSTTPTPAATPEKTTQAPVETTTAPARPGQTKVPPGRDPNKTHGPKR